jgi:hypothetical protein
MRTSVVAAALVLSSFSDDSRAERATVHATFPVAYAQAKAAIEKLEFELVDDFPDIGTLRARKEAPSSSWITCARGVGTFIKTVLTVTLTFGTRASGELVVDVEVTGTSHWYRGDRASGFGTPLSNYDLFPCTPTGVLEHELLEDIVDPVTPIRKG